MRWLELVLVFGVAPLVLALASRRMVTLGIIGSGILSLVALLLDPTFPRRQLWDAALARQGLRALAIRTLFVWAGLLIVTLLFFREHLFEMPRTRPVAWLLVMILYPPISAYSQEIMFRTLFFHRYAMLLRTPAARVIASGLLFGWAHIVVHNLTAICARLHRWPAVRGDLRAPPLDAAGLDRARALRRFHLHDRARRPVLQRAPRARGARLP